MARSKTSLKWLQEHFNDPYVKKAQKDGYRARAAYKLKEIDDLEKLIKPEQVIVDLGCAPGSWSQYVRHKLAGKDGGGIRGTIIENNTDLYGGPGVAREVYAIRGVVRPGNSGGPLLTADGRVAGTVFAMSALDPQTGYVLTDAATAPLLDAAGALSEPVPTAMIGA